MLFDLIHLILEISTQQYERFHSCHYTSIIISELVDSKTIQTKIQSVLCSLYRLYLKAVR